MCGSCCLSLSINLGFKARYWNKGNLIYIPVSCRGVVASCRVPIQQLYHPRMRPNSFDDIKFARKNVFVVCNISHFCHKVRGYKYLLSWKHYWHFFTHISSWMNGRNIGRSIGKISGDDWFCSVIYHFMYLVNISRVNMVYALLMR